MVMNAVLAFSRRVKRKTEMPSERTITNTRFGLKLSDTEPPTMMGKSGKMQGARTVRTPAMKEMRRKLNMRELYHRAIVVYKSVSVLRSIG